MPIVRSRTYLAQSSMSWRVTRRLALGDSFAIVGRDKQAQAFSRAYDAATGRRFIVQAPKELSFATPFKRGRRLLISLELISVAARIAASVSPLRVRSPPLALSRIRAAMRLRASWVASSFGNRS